ncbi:MAG: hypothetical protein M3394_03985, partial [Actinomycetota bacterium]|nr:hypothetical protein [Actinomycetota bacterium]
MNLAVAFASAVRACGLDVPVDSVVTFAQALAAVGLERRDDVYWAGRATLVHRPEDIAAYDQAFAAFWTGESWADVPSASSEEPTVGFDIEGQEEDGSPLSADPSLVVRFSPREVLRHKDFAAYTSEEAAEARRLMADMRLAGALRRSRRLTPTRRAGRGRP